MSVNVNDKSGLVDSHTPGYSACGCGNRRYYTKAEIDEMLKGVLDPDEIEAILNQMFEEYIESGDLYELILSVIGDVYTKDEVNALLAGKLDVTAFTQAMASETARTENTYAKKSDIPPAGDYATTGWVESQNYLKDITLTINGTELHNNGEIIIEGGGGEPVDISGKLDTSAFTAYTASTETWENNMEDCCDEVKTYIDYLLYLANDLQRQIDELKPEPGPEPTPTGDTFTLTAVYDVTSTTEPTKILNATTHISGSTNVLCIDKFSYNGIEHTGNTFTFPATGEQTVEIHFIKSIIPRWCFFETPLKRVTIPNGITVIGGKSFALTKVTSITIPDSVTEIGMEALEFALGSGNFEIHIGSGLQKIDSYINPKARGTQNIYFASATPPTYTGSSSVFTKAGITLNIYVPTSGVQAYKSAPGFTNVADLIQGI